MSGADVIVVGAGHNGLVCACYLARAGLEVEVVEAAAEPGGCIATAELPDRRGRLELGAYEHGGIVGTGVAAELELEQRFGLDLHMREELVLAPSEDGSALAFWSSLERTVEGLAEVVGRDQAAAYERFAGWAQAVMALLRQSEAGPPPTLRELAAVADAGLGAQGARMVQTLLASSRAVTGAAFTDDRLRGVLDHWAARGLQPPDEPGSAAGALHLAAGHGGLAARPAGGSRATIDALVRCLEASGGRLRCGAAVERIVVEGSRATGVVAGGELRSARRAVVSAIDARRVFGRLVEPRHVPSRLRAELSHIHVGEHNASDLKVDAVVEGLPQLPGPAGFERALVVSPNGARDLSRSFAQIRLGELPDAPPLMIGFPSALEDGWAPPGRHVVWILAPVPWRLRAGGWTPAALERAADMVWAAAERRLGGPMPVVERSVLGPEDWRSRTGNETGNHNHLDMSLDQLLGNRPTPSLARYRTPVAALFLTGAGTHPGGGVTGAPGRNAAGAVLEELGIRRGSRGARLRARIALMRDAARAARALMRAT